MEEEDPHKGSLYLQQIRSCVKELELLHRNFRDQPEESRSSDSQTLVQDFALQFETKVKEVAEEYIDVDLLDVEDSDAYLEYLRKELHFVEAESVKVSEEIVRLSMSHVQGSILVFFCLFNVEENEIHAIVKNPALFWDKVKIGKIMRSYIILHNMIVEDERDVYTQFDVSEFQQGEGNESSHVDLLQISPI